MVDHIRIFWVSLNLFLCALILFTPIEFNKKIELYNCSKETLLSDDDILTYLPLRNRWYIRNY